MTEYILALAIAAILGKHPPQPTAMIFIMKIGTVIHVHITYNDIISA